MSTCEITKLIENDWPEQDDDSGDKMFLMEENSLLRDIQAAKRKETKDVFLFEVPEEKEGEEEKEEEEKKVKFDDLDKKNKVAYILNQLEKYKNNDL
jgi:hypothetical protein